MIPTQPPSPQEPVHMMAPQVAALPPAARHPMMTRAKWRKFGADGKLSRYKARLVANRKSQEIGVDCDETFSPVVKPATIRLVLDISLSRQWPIHQLDIKNAFLNDALEETVYMHQSPGFRDPAKPDHVANLIHLYSSIIEQMAPPISFSDTRAKLSADVGPSVKNPTLYRSFAGALQYLTFTRPDNSFAVQQVCLFMHDPREVHFNALKRILRYVKGTLDYGLQLYLTTSSGLVAYSDADWAGCLTTRRSTSGYCIFHDDNLISWSAKHQHIVSRSTTETEFRGVANTISEKKTWLRNILLELHCPLSKATLVYCDNISAVYLSTNSIQHQHTKHVEIDLHFVRERIALGTVCVLHVPSSLQYADIFTRGLPTPLFNEFRHSLNIICNDAKTEGE
ncbi:Reverse transcriptase RNA-dependent DNA polymerase [Arabidopsis suecica]|uniref:Reverse transcriptase RNA-dependent DNA polymerase n=1 Tax=Arabidopsis suecica TaxID=45249 RepID=A0A8T1XQ57_ARASU|nr:Reverse transcriptase RNA-dependent DNA polymerase [Arabidopsis suecica]